MATEYHPADDAQPAPSDQELYAAEQAGYSAYFSGDVHPALQFTRHVALERAWREGWINARDDN